MLGAVGQRQPEGRVGRGCHQHGAASVWEGGAAWWEVGVRMAWLDYHGLMRQAQEGLGLCWRPRKGPPSVEVLPHIHSERPPNPPGAGLPAEVSPLPWTSKSPQLGGTYRRTGSFGHCSWGAGRVKRQERVSRTDLPQMPCGVSHLEDREDFAKVEETHPVAQVGDSSFCRAPTWAGGTPNPPLSHPAPLDSSSVLLTLPPLYLLDLSAVPSSQSWHHPGSPAGPCVSTVTSTVPS